MTRSVWPLPTLAADVVAKSGAITTVPTNVVKPAAVRNSTTRRLWSISLNLTNTAKFRGIDNNAIDQASFGRITQQAGFMRIWQLSFRYTF
jgi:hypothetical protein